MSYDIERGPEVTYRVAWSATDRKESAPPSGGFSRAHAERAATPSRSAAGPVGTSTHHRSPSPSKTEDTPLFAATSLLDWSAPVVLEVAAEDTPLFNAIPRYDEVRQTDEKRLIRAFNSLPPRWQEILWFTEVEDISVTEASIHLRLNTTETGVLADQAVIGLRRAWVADDLGEDAVPQSCASALWALCGAEDWQGLGHVRSCTYCADVAGRLGDVVVRTPQVLLNVALGQLGKGAYAQAV